MSYTMHSFEQNPSSVPAFLIKLWKLVEDSSCNELIAWSDASAGKSFIIKDQTRFSKELLPQYFKHNNMASFIRQLNMYGFRKVMNYEKSGLQNENDRMEFQHSFFKKGEFNLLELIKRKIPNTKVTEPAVKSNNARDILTDLSSIREKQENMDNMLLKMKQENELLWRELTNMRKKHKAQEHVIQKVIQFLVSIVQRNNQNIGVQRKLPRMLHGSSGNQGNSQVACTIDVLRKKNPNFIAVPPDKIVSPLGPVIHEVTDFEHEYEENLPSPSVKSPENKTENNVNNSENENQESECPPISSLNSPINTSATMEPLSILEPLHPSPCALSNDDGAVEESVLGIPLEYIAASPSNIISIPDEESSDNIISLPDSSDAGVSFNYNSPGTIVYSTSSKSEFDDSLLSEPLQTPKIPTIHLEDIFPITPKSKEKVSKQKSVENKIENQQQNELNYQLAVSDFSNALKPSTLSKNTFSNHLLSVEQDLNWLQDQISSSSNWNNIDASKLLGLFSTDDTTITETLAGEITDQTNIKTEPIDIVGNELVQFTPNMLDAELGIENNQFLQSLTQESEASLADVSKSEDQKVYLGDLLIETDQAAASQAADFLLSNGSPTKQKSVRQKLQKLQKGKRRKLK